MAAGKPIIGSLNGAGAKIVKEAQAGLVSEAGNAELLAENILCLYNNIDGQREIFGKKAVNILKSNLKFPQLQRSLQIF